MNAPDRAFEDWYADRDNGDDNATWWHGDHECDDTCDCAIQECATAYAHESIVEDLDEREAAERNAR